MALARRGWKFLAAAAMAAGMLATAASQTTRPAGPTLQPTTTTRPAVKISQPAEFLALAAKATKTKSVYVKGAAILEPDKPQPDREDARRVEFEIWVRQGLAKQRLIAPYEEVRVSDGKFVYTLRQKPNARPQGRRRRIDSSNMYHALEVAAVFCDAACGYAGLAAAVKFVPVAGDPKYDKKLPDLKWFRLSPQTRPPHHLLREVKEVKIGISAEDGLARVLVGRSQREGRTSTVAVVFETVRRGGAGKEDFKLPPQAARAEWIDADADGEQPKIISVPKHLIAAPGR